MSRNQLQIPSDSLARFVESPPPEKEKNRERERKDEEKKTEGGRKG